MRAASLIPYKIHTVLTDNSTHFTTPGNARPCIQRQLLIPLPTGVEPVFGIIQRHPARLVN